MITVRPSDQRGHFDFGWLDTRHSFAFGEFFPPRSLPHSHGFRSLRVINEDVVAPGRGFGQHPHSDMEIITYVISGAVAHKDTTGGQETIKPGDVQVMTAGSGLEHSEFNPSKTEPLHLMQIWIRPSQRGLTPGYSQKHFPLDARKGRLGLVAAPAGTPAPAGATDPLVINQDARLYVSTLDAGQDVALALGAGRHAWVQIIKGEVSINSTSLRAGDGAAISDEPALAIRAAKDAELMVFDLA